MSRPASHSYYSIAPKSTPGWPGRLHRVVRRAGWSLQTIRHLQEHRYDDAASVARLRMSRHANAPRDPSPHDCRVDKGNACYTECVVEKVDLPLHLDRRPLYALAG